MKFIAFFLLSISGFCGDTAHDYDVPNPIADVRNSLAEYVVALRATTNYAQREQLKLETRSKYSKSAAKFMSTLVRQKGAQSLDALQMYQFFDCKHCLFDLVFRLNLQEIEMLKKKIDRMSYSDLVRYIGKRSKMSYTDFEAYIKTKIMR